MNEFIKRSYSTTQIGKKPTNISALLRARNIDSSDSRRSSFALSDTHTDNATTASLTCVRTYMLALLFHEASHP